MARTVLQKLGYPDGGPARILGLPAAQGPLFATVQLGHPPVWQLAFCPDAASVEPAARALVVDYVRGQHLWFAYPKRTSRLASDLYRDAGWRPLDALGLLAVTQVALDADWSALRFRYRDEVKTITRRFETT